MLQAFEAVERVLRLDSDRLDRSVVLLEPARRADEGPGGAEPRDEMCDPSGRLLEDLDSGAFVVRTRICRVRVLVGIEVALGVQGHDVPHHPNRTIGPFAGVAVDDLGSVRGDQGLALGADVGGHHELDAIALGRAD